MSAFSCTLGRGPGLQPCRCLRRHRLGGDRSVDVLRIHADPLRQRRRRQRRRPPLRPERGGELRLRAWARISPFEPSHQPVEVSFARGAAGSIARLRALSETPAAFATAGNVSPSSMVCSMRARRGFHALAVALGVTVAGRPRFGLPLPFASRWGLTVRIRRGGCRFGEPGLQRGDDLRWRCRAPSGPRRGLSSRRNRSRRRGRRSQGRDRASAGRASPAWRPNRRQARFRFSRPACGAWRTSSLRAFAPDAHGPALACG